MYVDGFPLVQQRKNIENTTTFCNNEYWYGIFRLSVLIKGGWGSIDKDGLSFAACLSHTKWNLQYTLNINYCSHFVPPPPAISETQILFNAFHWTE